MTPRFGPSLGPTLGLTTALLLALAAPVYASDDHDHDHDHDHAEEAADTDDHVSEIGDLRVIHGWAPAVSGDVATVYFDIEVGETAVVMGAPESDIAEHAHVMGAPIKAGGEPVELGSFPLSAEQEFILGPESVYIALEGLTEPLVEGEEFEIEVTFEPVGTLHVNVEVTKAGSTQHPHAGHNH
ncbi:MAG: copper chaperone PCu(A)C [Pseudomonadota bacterium]